eukprot:TRINITY_DN33017_c0_g1_i1.p2 TRINITY_DN33017_c0_g1~~TRINITY_DN33017_c0_g1_i1.p2  ORF type:complete len:269 (+),score=80.66 TRINITY_DN33017_c0_g1_i1:110-916(+)
MTSTRLEWKLEALQYPYEWSEATLCTQQVQNMVVWLEDTQIRWHTEEERGYLRDTAAGEGWWGSFKRYVHTMGYRKDFPVPPADCRTDVGVRMALDWVVGKAITLSYSDDADRYNEAHKKYKQLGMGNITVIEEGLGTAEMKATTFDITDKATLQQVASDILAVLQLPPTEDLPLALTAIARTLREIQAHVHADRPGAAKMTTQELLERVPLQYETGDKRMDAAVRVLRILYTADLRDLQDRIDEIVVELQEHTADPKTDARLGKVGM